MMKKLLMVIGMMPFMTLAGTIGEALNCTSLNWTTGGTPSQPGENVNWYCETGDSYSDGMCAASGAGGAGDATSWLKTTIVGPAKISYRYKVQTYNGSFRVTRGSVSLYNYSGVTGTSASWQYAEYDIPSGTWELKFEYHHPGMGYVNQLNGVRIDNFTVAYDRTPASLASALGADNLTFTTGGNADWFVQAEEKHDGQDAVRSGAIGDNQSSWMQTTISGAKQISFWWKVSSESGYDFLKFYVDSAEKKSVSGTGGDWVQVTMQVTGTGVHTLKWQYSKDGSVNGGCDCGWVDQLVISDSPVSSATTYYVNGTTGSDSNTGLSVTAAKKTIQAAIDAAANGSVIRVAAGSYVENVSVTKSSLTLFGERTLTTTIDGSNAGHCITLYAGAENCVLDGFIIQNGRATNSGNTYGGGIDCNVRATIRNCIVRDNGGNQYFSGGLHCGGSACDVSVYNCLFVGNSVSCSGGAVLSDGEANVILDRCTIYNNSCSGWNRIGGVAVANSAIATVKNSIVWGNASAQFGSYSGARSGSLIAEYCCVQNGWSGPGNISDDPRFADTECDFALQGSSPCRGAGEDGIDLGFSRELIQPSDNGLVAWYKFDGNANDSSRNGYDLIVRTDVGDTNPVPTEDRFGNECSAYCFNGDEKQVFTLVDAPKQMEPIESSFSFSLWFQTDCSYSDYGAGWAWNLGNYAFFPVHGGDNGGAGLGVKVGADGVEIVEHAGFYMPTVLSYEANLGTGWNHVAVTIVNDGAPILYVNGVMVGEGTVTEKTKKVCPIGIGGGSWGYYTGKVDDVRIYDRALSAAEVKALYESEGGSPVGGVQLWENGPYWAECNVGASNAEDEGWSFLFGDTKAYRRVGDTGDQWEETGSVVSAGATDPAEAYWGEGWRCPTGDEYRRLFINCDYHWEVVNGVTGWRLQGRGSFRNNSIFIPLPPEDPMEDDWLRDYRTDSGDVAQILSEGAKCWSDDSRRIGPCLVHWWGFEGSPALLRAVRDTPLAHPSPKPAVHTVSFYKTLKHWLSGKGMIEDREVNEDAAIGALPSVSMEGFSFDGWWVIDENYEGKIVNAYKTRVNADTVVTEDMVICGKWIANTYSIELDANGGSVSPAKKSVVYEDMVDALPTPVRAGYTFDGWFMSDGRRFPSEVLEDDGDGSCYYTIASDLTLRAQWTPIRYAITYINTMGVANPNPVTYTIEDELTFQALSDVLGWRFVEWSLDGISLGSTGDKTVSARWAPVTYGITYTGVKGGVNPNPISYTIEDAITFSALGDVTGYRFTGWSPLSIARGTTGNKTVAAQYAPIVYSISYVNTMGAANPNPTSYTIEDAVTFAALPDVEGWRFVGWSFAGISRGNTGDVTVSANWESTTPSVVPDVDDEEPMDAGVANTYDGIIMDADGLPVGYISIKAAKASGKGEVKTSKVTATIQMAGEAKKVTVKGNVNVSEATLVQHAPDGRVLDLIFTRNSIFGTFDDYEIEGVRNILASTAKGDKGSEAKQRAENVYNRLKGNYVMAYGDENGWNGLSVSIMTKGKVKVSGALADGTKVSTSTQMIVGEDYSCIPVIYTKKNVSLAFSIYSSNRGDESFVFGYYDAVISRVAALDGERVFCLDGDFYGLFDEAGYELVEDYLPWEVSVAPKGTKWIVADGVKAGQIKMDKDGEVYDAKESDNPSGLKLTFTAKTGLFKGSFKVYAIDAKGKLKSFSATVNGIVVDGLGYGTATIKKIGSVPVAIE